MTNHDLLERSTATDRNAPLVAFLRSEFPAWTFSIDETATWSQQSKPLWIATRDGHHPQSALTAGKLHRRLSDYEARIAARSALSN